MKNTLLLIAIIFSFNAIGADKPKTEFDKHGNIVTDIGAVKFTTTGLEGWGKKGVRIEVLDYSDRDKNFPLKAIKTKVELRLLQAGINASRPTSAFPCIIIDAHPIGSGSTVVGYAVSIGAMRQMEFKALDNTGKLVTYSTFADTQRYGGISPSSGLITFIDKQMDKLLLDYLKANPKK